MRFKTSIFVFLIALFCLKNNMYGENVIRPFSLSKSNISRVQNVERIIQSTTQINVSSWNAPIYGLSVNAQINLKKSDSFVRIILLEKGGNEYLVAECNKILSDTSHVELFDYCEETRVLTGIIPVLVKVVIHNAELNLCSFNIAESFSSANSLSETEMKGLRQIQVEEKVLALNRYNYKHNIPWRGAVTGISLEPYSVRKAMMGVTSDEADFGGFEYYRSGIFCHPSVFANEKAVSAAYAESDSNYVKNFDWRNRHGKNWITPAKRQIGLTCWAFCTISAIEAYINLYFNKMLNYDLSEQDLITNAKHEGNFSSTLRRAFGYAKGDGIVLEDCMPFIFPDTTSQRCENPSDILYIEKYNFRSSRKDTINLPFDTLKSRVIRSPSPISMRWGKVNETDGHAVLLIGFKQLGVGDTIDFAPYWDKTDNKMIINEGSPYKGLTAWIIKNSLGTDWGDNGCCYFLTCDTMKIYSVYSLQGKIKSSKLSEGNIRIIDSDGDGFYTWGVGERPKDFPMWLPQEQDGDDSNYAVGPMDAFGHCRNLSKIQNDTLYIHNDTIWDSPKYLYKHVVIGSGVSLTISSTATFYQGFSVVICPKGNLVVSGGEIRNAILNPQKSSSIIIKEGGHIVSCKKQKFSLPSGCNLTINNGSIN